MHQCGVDQLLPGMPIGQDIYNEQRQVLLTKGTPLTGGYIEGLQMRSFPVVWVMDGVADDLTPPDILSPWLRATTSMHLESLFLTAQKLAAQSDVSLPASELGEELAAVAKSQFAEIYDDAQSLVEVVTRANTLSGVMTIKSHDHYTFEHSVEVATAAVILGHRVGLEDYDLESLAVGCLFHDFGKVIVPAEILNKSDALTDDELELIKMHTEEGFHLARKALGEGAIIPRNIIRQHHERQDGKGYAQGLHGNNRFDLAEKRPYGQAMIMPAAEIVAVADVYSALASDRPFRPSMKPEQIVGLLKEIAGSHLNQDLVIRFLSMLPVYPVCGEVVFISSKLRGYRGVVTKINSRLVNRPVVRVVFDPQGREIAPFEVDTAKERDLDLAPSSYAEMVSSRSS